MGAQASRENVGGDLYFGESHRRVLITEMFTLSTTVGILLPCWTTDVYYCQGGGRVFEPIP